MPSNSSDSSSLSGGSRRRRRIAIGLIAVGIAIGIIGMLGAERADQHFSSNEFCISCHSMEKNAFSEFKQSRHGTTATGVSPTCAHCHLSAGLVPVWIDHVFGTKDLIVELTRDFSQQSVYDDAVPAMADTVRMRMLAEGSRNCQKCHSMSGIQPTRSRGQAQHKQALNKGNANCIACHYNLVHREVPLSAAFSKAAEPFQ